jgi:hypothetical protein
VRAGDVYSPATGTCTATGPMVYPCASPAAAVLPNGQVLYGGGTRVKYCGQYSCDEPLAAAELPGTSSRQSTTSRDTGISLAG